MYYLKNNEIPEKFKAPGLKEAKKQLNYDRLSAQEKIDYDHHIKQILYERNSIYTSQFKGEYRGHKKGLAEGLAIGRAEGRAEGEAFGFEKVVINSHRAGLSIEIIAISTHILIFL